MADWVWEQGFDAWLAGEEEPEPFSVMCKFCHNDQLAWHQGEFGWRLVDRNLEVHSCDEYFAAIGGEE